MRQINRLFKNGKPPSDIDERNAEIIDWNEKTEILLNELDNKFWEDSTNLGGKLLEHIERSRIGEE